MNVPTADMPIFGWEILIHQQNRAITPQVSDAFIHGQRATLPRCTREIRTLLELARAYSASQYPDVLRHEPENPLATELTLHASLLCVRSQQLLGQTKEAEERLNFLRKHRQKSTNLTGWWHLDLVLGEWEINCGRFVAGRRYLENASLGRPHMGLFERLRLSTAHCHVAQAQGKASQAAGALAEQKQLISALGFPDFLQGWRRRRIIFFLDTEDYVRADHALREALADPALSSRMRLLLLKEKLRLELRRGSGGALTEVLGTIDALVESEPQLQGVAAFHEERCELELQQQGERTARSQEIFEEQMREADKKNDIASRCLTRFLLGRLLASSGHFEKAMKSLEEAEALARQDEYGRVLVRILVFRVGLLLRLRQNTQASLVLAEAEHRASQAHLPVQMACCRMLRHHSEGSSPPIREMVEVFNRLRSLHEFTEYMRFYGLSDRWMTAIRPVSGSRKAETIPLLVCAERIFPVRGWYILEKHRLVLHSTGRTIRMFSDLDGLLTDRLIAHVFLKVGEDCHFSEFHGLALPQVPYRSLRHSAKVRTLLRRARVTLTALRARLIPGSESETICAKTEDACFRISLEENHAPRQQTQGLAERILARILQEPRAAMETHTLCEEFQLSRQRLTYTLKPLRLSGRLRVQNRGRSSRWVAVTDSGDNPCKKSPP